MHDDEARWWLWLRFERGLARMVRWSSPRVFGAFLAWFVGWTAVMTVVLDVLITGDQRAELTEVASSLVPALGVLFSFLTGFVISSQWNRSRAAEGAAGSEADAAVRFALASQSPGLDGPRIRGQLLTYLRSVVDDEWQTLVHHPGSAQLGDQRTAGALARLEVDARAAATVPSLGSAVSGDLLAAAEGLAVARRNRLNLSGHGLPAPLFLLVFVAGVVLSLDAIALTGGVDGVTILAVGGLVVLIALDLALIVAISDPFHGPMRALPSAIAAVSAELAAGAFDESADDTASG